MEQLSSANSLFALELFRTLNESSPTGNIFFSPFSVSSALAMVFLGAKGSTAAQLSKIEEQLTSEELHKCKKCENLENISISNCPGSRWKSATSSTPTWAAQLQPGMPGSAGFFFSSSKADLSHMSGSRDLFISKIVHKSFVAANEEGTEAATATAGSVEYSLGMIEAFTVDHPFLFFIRYNPTANVLFFGSICSP